MAGTELLPWTEELLESPPATDRELLGRLADDDDAALEEIVNRYLKMVYGICRRLLPSEKTAADAAQATFLLLARLAPRLAAKPEPLGGWLLQAAVKVARCAKQEENGLH